MFEINITVSCPDLVNAAMIFAAAMGAKSAPTQTTTATPISAPLVTQDAVNPVTANPTTGHLSMNSMPQSCPSDGAPAGTVPLAQGPSYTLEQVSKAGADLLTAQPAKLQELLNLLSQFGVQTVDALRPDQLGAFATALRGMGAQI